MAIEDIPVNILMEFVKGVACVYDIVTLPVYALIQRPWNQRRRTKAVRAKQTDPSDPYSPWVRVGTPPPCLADGCESIDESLRRSIKAYGDQKCFGYRETIFEEQEKQPDGKVFLKKIQAPTYKWLSYNQVNKRVDDIMRGLLLNDVKPKDKVLIFMETRMEWMLTAQALYRMGATLATLYATLGDEGIVHGINEIEATHIVTSSDLIPKLKKLQEKIPKVTHIIYVEAKIGLTEEVDYSEGFERDMKIVFHEALEKQGSQASPDLKGVPPKGDDLALIMYTSGSTGTPKGVMASHKNFIAAITGFNTVLYEMKKRIGGMTEDDIYVGYLPLAHNLEFTAENLVISMGIPVGYSTPFTLTDKSLQIKEGSPGDASILKPAALAAVPLVLDRIRKGVQEQVEGKGKMFKKVFDFAIDYKNYWNDRGFGTPIVNYLICRKIRASLGGRVNYLFCGGAPLSPDTQSFAKSCLDIKLLQGYGTTETTAVGTLMDLDDINLGRSGAPMYGVKIRLIDWDEGNYRATDKPNPRGEIVIGGPNITFGYFKNEATTEEVFKDEDGTRWFYSGDIGEIYPDGTLQIIDRKKDLLKLQFGEYVSLGKVEAELKSCSFVDNICVYGDSFENYIVAIIIPNPPALLNLGKTMGKNVAKFESLCDDSDVKAYVLKAVIEHGKKAGLHKSEIPMKLKLCKEEWTPDSGLVTAALKIRRKQIKDFYIQDINKMYGTDTNANAKKTDANSNAIK